MHTSARRRPYLVTVHPDGRWWHIRVPELPHAVSQALQLRDAPTQARDLIASWLDVPAAQVKVIVRRRGGLQFGWSDALRAAHGID